MAIIDEKQRIRKLVEKVKEFETQKEQLKAMAEEKSRNDKTHLNKCYYGQYENEKNL